MKKRVEADKIPEDSTLVKAYRKKLKELRKVEQAMEKRGLEKK